MANILGGRALQDVWIVYGPGAGATEPLGYGTTVRVYDAGEDLWRIKWMGVLNHNCTMFKAREVGTEVILEAAGDAGEHVRWVFDDITERTFSWRAQDSTDGSQTWIVRQRTTARRRN